jgi:hypothetical protein
MNRLEQDLSGADQPGIDDSCPITKIYISQHDRDAKVCNTSFEKREAGSPIKNGAKLDLRDDCTQRGATMDFIHPMASDCVGNQNEVILETRRAFNTDIKSMLFDNDTIACPTRNVPSDGSIHDVVHAIPTSRLETFGNVSDSSLKSLHTIFLPQDSRTESDEPQSLQNLFIRHRKKDKAKKRTACNKQVLLPTSFGVRSLPREIELRKDDNGSSHAQEFTRSMHESFP